MTRSLSARVRGKLRERPDPAAPPLANPLPGPTQPAPIFIIGCQRSGTSLLRRVLDSHSRIACPPESKFVLQAVAVLRDPGAARGLASMGYERAAVTGATATFVGAFFRGYAASQGKPRWADKTPAYVDCLPELWDLFGPGVRFVMLARHGLDVAFSLADPHRHYPAIDGEVAGAGGNVPVGAARFWAGQNRKMLAFRDAHPEACRLLSYEDMTARPEECLPPVFEFLGEAWEPDVLRYDHFVHHRGYEDPEVRRRRRIEPNSGRHREWPPSVVEETREACRPMLRMLGYE